MSGADQPHRQQRARRPERAGVGKVQGSRTQLLHRTHVECRWKKKATKTKNDGGRKVLIVNLSSISFLTCLFPILIRIVTQPYMKNKLSKIQNKMLLYLWGSNPFCEKETVMMRT